MLPPSFPYGGMENPCLTFLTPTLLAGDRSVRIDYIRRLNLLTLPSSLVDVVVHEIMHSWSGNLVTNSTWAHFWLNEGFTVFLERKVTGRMHGEQARHFSAINGWSHLIDAVENFGATHKFTALIPKFEDVDPDDSFSSIPYEKGSAFLFYLEMLV